MSVGAAEPRSPPPYAVACDVRRAEAGDARWSRSTPIRKRLGSSCSEICTARARHGSERASSVGSRRLASTGILQQLADRYSRLSRDGQRQIGRARAGTSKSGTRIEATAALLSGGHRPTGATDRRSSQPTRAPSVAAALRNTRPATRPDIAEVPGSHSILASTSHRRHHLLPSQMDEGSYVCLIRRRISWGMELRRAATSNVTTSYRSLGA